MKTSSSHLPTAFGMLALALTLAFPARAAVEVRGLGSSSGDTVLVEIHADITEIPIISYTCKLFYDPDLLAVRHGQRDDSVWYLSDGHQHVDYLPPDTSIPGQVEFVGAKMDGNDPLAGVQGLDILLGLVLFERRRPDTPSFDLSIGREGEYASFVTRHGVVLEARPGEVEFTGVWPVQHDKDMDGLSDEWEIEFFKDPELAYYSEDPDGDGYDNLGEEGFGTDPTDRRSHLAYTASLPDPRRLVLEWHSTEGRIYTVEHSQDLESFRPLLTGIKATPPRNTVDVEVSGRPEAHFFKLKLESFPRP